MADPGFILQPDVYSSEAEFEELVKILEELWTDLDPETTVYIASAFANQSGVLPFAKKIAQHTDQGGNVRCFLAGSPHQALASRQAVIELLRSGAEVYLLNRKKIFHSKMYGVAADDGQALVVTSGNLTGNGMSLNVESSVILDDELVENIGFNWLDCERQLLQKFEWHEPQLSELEDDTNPAWQLTFDEEAERRRHVPGEEEGEGERDEVLAVSLVHSDIYRIQDPDEVGTAYFWLSRYHAQYFPPLKDRTRPEAKTTLSTEITVEFLDVGEVKDDVSVTFEAYNNLDFRLLVTPLKGTKTAGEDDIAILARESEERYKLKILEKGSKEALRVRPYLIHDIGHKGKRYGWVPRNEVAQVL